jgi:hypothetical protein
MNNSLFVALVAAALSSLLSVVLPCALKSQSQPFVVSVRNMFQRRRESLLVSAVVVAVVVYASMELAPEVRSNIPAGLANFVGME